MRRGYNREVDPRVPADCVENTRPLHPAIYRFHSLGLYDDENKNCDVCGNGQVGQCKG